MGQQCSRQEACTDFARAARLQIFRQCFPLRDELKAPQKRFLFRKFIVRKLDFSNEKHAVKHCQFKFTQF